MKTVSFLHGQASVLLREGQAFTPAFWIFVIQLLRSPAYTAGSQAFQHYFLQETSHEEFTCMLKQILCCVC